MVILNYILTLLSALIVLVSAAPVDIPKNHTYLVTDLPGITNIDEKDRPLMYAGHIEVDAEADTNYFFWKFIKQQSNFNRTIIWLNGGPGCSSMDGALMETGPLRVNSEGTLDLNEGSWYEAADMIFVDQPGGTGFSITKDYDQDLGKVASHFVKFLKNYLDAFPEDQDQEFYLAGESYAGQYIPFIGDAIIKSNDAGESDINLAGMLIGNGWIAPDIQSLSYIPFALESGLIKNNDEFMPLLLKDHEQCQKLVNEGNGDKFSYNTCEMILNRILQYSRDKSAVKDQQCYNMYDFRLKDSYPSCGMNWPPLLFNIEPYLQKAEVVESLNLDIKKVKAWRECDGRVSDYLKNLHTRPAFNLLPGLLERVKILLFNGNKDLICNNRGVLDTIAALHWGGSQGFSEDAIEYDWYYDGNITGSFKTDKNLTFINVHDSSHMVPFDKPFESRGLFDIFVGNYQIVENNATYYLETPVYSDSQGPSDDKNDNDEASPEETHKSPLPFVIYMGSIIGIGAVIFYINKNKAPKSHSILKNKASKANSKKTVSWADENQSVKVYDHAGNFGSFFNNYSEEPRYQPTANDEHDDYDRSLDENFEMQSNVSNKEDDYNPEIDGEDITNLKPEDRV